MNEEQKRKEIEAQIEQKIQELYYLYLQLDKLADKGMSKLDRERREAIARTGQQIEKQD